MLCDGAKGGTSCAGYRTYRQMLPSEVPEYRVHTKLSRVEHWRHLVEIVALVSAAIWAFYVFVYQERIKPASEAPRMEVAARLTHEPLQGDKELVTINVTMKNTSSAEIAVGALLVNAYGVLYKGGRADKADLHPTPGIIIVNRGLASARPVLLYGHLVLWQPLATHRPLTLPIGEELTLAEPFVIKRHQYDTVRLTYAYCYQRSDDSAVSAYVPKRMPDGAFDVSALLKMTNAHAGLRCGGTLNFNGEYAL